MNIFEQVGEFVDKWRRQRHYEKLLKKEAKEKGLSLSALHVVYDECIQAGDTPKTAYVKAINKVRTVTSELC